MVENSFLIILFAHLIHWQLEVTAVMEPALSQVQIIGLKTKCIWVCTATEAAVFALPQFSTLDTQQPGPEDGWRTSEST